MRFVKLTLLASTLFSTLTIAAQAEINVAASIKPVHSLVAAVMKGVGSPDLIVEGAGSPHTYALKPSQAVTLEKADLVFWIGHELEAFLEKPLEAIAKNAKSIELIDAHGLNKVALREGGAFDAHAHDDEHGHKDEHGHESKPDEKHAHGHDDHGSHDEHGAFDPHVWLDPMNAKALVHEIEEALVEVDPSNKQKYKANAQVLTSKLDKLVAEVSADLAPVKDKGFVVFHDAYQNFEKRFGLSAIGSVTVSPEVLPGAERIAELQSKIKELKAVCVFSEPQFESKLVATVTEGTSARTGVLDPLGTSIADGPELYFKLIRNMSASFNACLSQKG